MSSAAMIEQAAAWSLRGVRCPGGVVASSVMTDDRLLPVLLTARTPTSPHLSRLVWLGEQLGLLADELVGLLHHDDVLNNLVAAEFDALRHAVSSARAAGGDVVLVASAAHHRAEQSNPPTTTTSG